MAGFFLTIEGVDGSGKSTQTERLARSLRETGREVVETREPGGTQGSAAIRDLVLTGDPGRWSPTTEMLLFFAARRDNLEKTIRPALARDAIVICDRWTDSTRAFQAGARPDVDGVTRAQIDRLHDEVIGLDPDLTLIFDMDPSEALNRGLARQTEEERFERLGGEFQQIMRQTYRQIAEAEPGRCRIIDAAGDVATVAERVLCVVQPEIDRKC